MKINLLATIIALLSYTPVFGQKYIDFPLFEKFYSNFGEHLKYTNELKDVPLSTLTLMKINFSANGEVQSVSFSDSALPQFVEFMQKVENKIDFNYIYEDIKGKLRSRLEVLVPIHIDYEKMDEWKSTTSLENIKNLYFFNGKPISGDYFLYPNIYFKYVIGRINQ